MHKPTLLFCRSLFAPFFRRTTAASTLLTAAAQWRADLPTETSEQRELVGTAMLPQNNT